MDNINIEMLLENLISVNEQILDALNDIKWDISSIKNELDWTQEYSHAKKVYEGLNEISDKLDTIDINTSNL